MDTPIEKQFYNSAKAYYLGATLLMNPTSPSAETVILPIQPALTCAALSLKLYLKCLLTIEGKDNDRVFRFAELYTHLKDNSRNAFFEKFKEFANNPSLAPADLVGHLETIDKAFAEWRYIHEEDAKGVDIADLEDMILAAKSLLAVAKPDWE